MILFRTERPAAGRMDIWCSEVRVKALTPERRNKLTAMAGLSGFVLKEVDGTEVAGEVVDGGGLYLMENGL